MFEERTGVRVVLSAAEWTALVGTSGHHWGHRAPTTAGRRPRWARSVKRLDDRDYEYRQHEPANGDLARLDIAGASTAASEQPRDDARDHGEDAAERERDPGRVRQRALLCIPEALNA